jgi:hypothetical protein
VSTDKVRADERQIEGMIIMNSVESIAIIILKMIEREKELLLWIQEQQKGSEDQWELRSLNNHEYHVHGKINSLSRLLDTIELTYCIDCSALTAEKV